MNRTPRLDDERLARWIAAVRAEADPGAVTRARARIAAAAVLPAWLAWMTRPAGLAVASVLLVVSVGSAAWLAPRVEVALDDDPIATLLGDDAAWGSGGDVAPAVDSGGVR